MEKNSNPGVPSLITEQISPSWINSWILPKLQIIFDDKKAKFEYKTVPFVDFLWVILKIEPEEPRRFLSVFFVFDTLFQ